MYGTGKGEDLPSVAACNAAGDESAALGGRLYEDSCIRASGDDAVPLYEVAGYGLCVSHVFRQQSASPHHLYGCVTVYTGIEVVEPVCQYADGVKAVLQGCPVCMDVYTVCQSAEDENIWTDCLQFLDERTDDILSVGSAVASAYNTDDVTAVEVGVAEIIERIGASGHSLSRCG